MNMMGHYNSALLVLSVSIAIISSYTALNIIIRLMSLKGGLKQLWWWVGAATFGAGIWSMHFIAMLALKLPMPVSYSVFWVSLSFILAILASAVAFLIVSRGLKRKIYILIGSLFITTGIVSMHYIGMKAMNMGVDISYDPILYLLSWLIAFAASVVSLYLFFYFQSKTVGMQLQKWMSSVVMAGAIAGMHFTGMAAMKMKPNHEMLHFKRTAIDSGVLAYTVAGGMLFIFACIIGGFYLDRRFQQTSTELEFKDSIYQSIILTASDAIVLCNSRGIIISFNKAAEIIFGYKEEEVLGKQLEIIIPLEYREAHRKGIDRYLRTKEPHVIGRMVELKGLRKNNEEFPLELSLSALKKGDETYFSGILRDISERKRTEEKITELVYRDPLTNLPNRRLLNTHLTMCIEQAAISGQMLAVLFIDLDRFKYINDTLGHDVGDAFLIEVAKRMETCIQKKDMLARQGGDEYIIVVSHTTHQQVVSLAKEILEKLNRPFLLGEHDLFITGSIGISMYPSDGMEHEILIKNADTAMYRAKELGKNNYQFFTAEMNNMMAKKMNLEIGLRKAIENHEFELYYQPQIGVNTGKMTGVEALIRWNHPEIGLVPPNDFIPLAEETGLIIPMGYWILRVASQQAKKWIDQGFDDLRMSVNISSRQFQQPDFVETVQTILSETGLPAKNLELELTESIVQNPKSALPVMEQLKAMGVKLSLDDFGTGYSSLSYLRSFPLDTLKIDKSFIRYINEEIKDEAIVKTIINMAHSLKLNVIAEGVETEEQLSLLSDNDCHEFQGYLFSRPVKADELQEILENHKDYKTD